MKKMLKIRIKEGNVFIHYVGNWNPTPILYFINRKCWNFYFIVILNFYVIQICSKKVSALIYIYTEKNHLVSSNLPHCFIAKGVLYVKIK